MLRVMSFIVLSLVVVALASAADLPDGWFLAGSNPEEYSVSVDDSLKYDGESSTRLASRTKIGYGFGTLMKMLKGESLQSLKGNRVRLTAHVRSKGVKDWAGVWMRVDGTGTAPLAFDNMQDRPIQGDSEWRPYSIVLDVPESATAVAFGVLLEGGGEVWIDTIGSRIEAVEESVPTTDQRRSDVTRDVAGHVVDDKGNAIDGATVVLTVKTFAPFHWMTFETKTEQGKFRFPRAYPYQRSSQMLITVYADGYAMTSDFVNHPKGDEVADRVLTMDEGTEMTFEFTDENGSPLAHTGIVPMHRITADGVRHQMYYNASQAADVMTDERGRCTLSRFNAGDRVQFAERGGEKREAEVKIDANPSQRVSLSATRAATELKQEAPNPTRAAPQHIRWLKRNALRFKSVDPADTDFSDLQALKSLIGDAKIVQLGEQSHGDAVCFQTKIRLIKFLHQEMGFDVLAFESGLYDCRRAWRAFQQGTSGHRAAREGVFGIWTESKQTAELWDYLADQASGDKPLELAGFDCQFTGTASANYLSDDIRELATTYAPEIKTARIDALIAGLPIVPRDETPPGDIERDLLVIDELQSALIDALKSADKPEREELSFWQQNLRSIKQHCLNESREYDGGGMDMRRDEQMARNLVWLSNDLYRNRKLIVWAASFHVMRNPSGIAVLSGSPNYHDLEQMGHLVHKELGDQVYTVGFTAYDGAAGPFMAPRPFEISPAPKGTLEDIFQKAGLQNGMIALKPVDKAGKWLTEKLYARPLGYSWMRANWHLHFDAMVFNKTMSPSTGR